MARKKKTKKPRKRETRDEASRGLQPARSVGGEAAGAGGKRPAGIPPGFTLRHTLSGHKGVVTVCTVTPDGRRVVSGSSDCTLKAWDLESGQELVTLSGHMGDVRACTVTPDGRRVVSGSRDCTLKVWDIESGQELATLSGHKGRILACAATPDGQRVVSASHDWTLKVWNLESGQELATLSGHKRDVLACAVTPDGRWVVSGSWDRTLKVWILESSQEMGRLPGHRRPVSACSVMPDGWKVVSGSFDKTLRVWGLKGGGARAAAERRGKSTNARESRSDGPGIGSSVVEAAMRRGKHDTNRGARVLEGHTRAVNSVAVSSDGRLLASKSDDGTVRLWRCDTWETVAVLDEPASWYWVGQAVAFHPREPVLVTLGEEDRVLRVWDLDLEVLLGAPVAAPTVHYTNAKVVLVGDSGVGKSGLGLGLTGQPFVPTESTHGRHVWMLESGAVEVDARRTETRETLLWDLAGQPGYRLFHRLSLHEVAVALVVFDARSETDPFAGVGYWAKALDEATRGFPLVKFLVAGRIDRGGPAVSKERVDEVLERYGFAGYFETSAKRGDGVAGLGKAIREAVPWDRLPLITAPQLFADIKDFLIDEKEARRVMAKPDELRLRYRTEKAKEDVPQDVFETCLGRLEAADLAARLSFSRQVLLQPEMLDNYCAWLALAARQEPDGLGFISEQRARKGDFPMDTEHRIPDPGDEQLMLVNAIEEVVGRGIAIRQPTEAGEMLVFPSELKTDIPDYPGGYILAVAFRFEGPVKVIYATLAVCLINAKAFNKEKLYKNAAIFRGPRDQVCGFAVDYPDKSNETLGRLVVFFDKDTETDLKFLFLRYVNQQLEKLALAGTVERERLYQCSCAYRIPMDAVALRKERGEKTAICAGCGRQWPIDELAEESAMPDERVDAIEARAEEEQGRQKRLAVLAERERQAQFHVFLCHNSKDKPDVRRLAGKLRDQGILPWIDEEGILAGDQFIPELEEIIDTVPVAAVIVGPHWLGRWQKQEYYAFLQRFVEHREERGKKRLRLIPVLLPGAPIEPELSVQPEFPVFLRGFSWVDFRKSGLDDREPLGRLIHAVLSEGWHL